MFVKAVVEAIVSHFARQMSLTWTLFKKATRCFYCRIMLWKDYDIKPRFKGFCLGIFLLLPPTYSKHKKPNKEELTDNGHYENIQEDIMLVNCLHDIACPRTLFSYLLCNGMKKEKCLPIKISTVLCFLDFLLSLDKLIGTLKAQINYPRQINTELG